MVTPETINDLRARQEVANERIKAVQLEREARILESALSLVESAPSVPEFVDRRESQFFDVPQAGLFENRVATPNDREHGNDAPFRQSEYDFLEQLGIARYIYKTDSTCIGMFSNLTNYVIGAGFEYKFATKDGLAVDESIPAKLQAIIDETFECNQWQPVLERNIFERSKRDGDFLLNICWSDKGHVRLRTEEAAHLTKPNDIRSLEEYCGEYGLDWDYGVATLPNDTSQVVGYFVHRGNGNDWDYLPESKAVHIKLNCDAEVKRGYSDLYCSYRSLDRRAKLLTNTAEGAAIQASIALIRKHSQGIKASDIESLVGSKTTSISVGNNTYKVKRALPGTILDTQNIDFQTGALGQNNSDNYIAVLQAISRDCGIRWNMTEAMITGSAADMAAYTAALAAESPFVKACMAQQELYKHYYRQMCWKVIGLYLSRFPVGYTVSQLKKMVTLDITAPTVEVQDRNKENELCKSQNESGILSRRTWQSKFDIDPEAESVQIAKEREEDSKRMVAQQQQMASIAPANPQNNDPQNHPENKQDSIYESQLTLEQANRILWGDYPAGRPNA